MENYNFILVFVSLCLCGHLRSAHAQTCQGPLYVYQEDCKAYFAAGYTSSGIYTIQPDYLPAFEVYCDMKTDGGGWTVLQRRQDGSEDFYRDWADYSTGFGNLNREHWLGLSLIRRITDQTSDNTLRIDLEDFDGARRYAKYSTFNVDDQEANYQLSVSGYSGDAGDSLSAHSGLPFSTRDRDNDNWGSNCAVRFIGAWWYGACHRSNLNGRYEAGSTTSYATGVIWYDFREYYYSLRVSEIKVRRN